MTSVRKLLATLIFSALSVAVYAQQNVHPQSMEYEWPKDSLVRQKLDQWQDQKFGMIIHWGLYAVPGIIESWSLCDEDWITRDSTSDYAEYKKWYWGLSKDFNPVHFNPDQWASAAKNAGMKYLVFTTKHHDGFCMWDTKQTDFNIAKGPFKDNPKADVAKYVFDAFRKQGMMVGAYFSKPDWHSENYWWPLHATPDRNNNYDIRKFPWRWQKFKDYTYNQIQELMTGYGKMDLLWLDGGWVRPLETVTDEVRNWGAAIPAWSQDIDMPKIAAMARKNQPGLLVVDRTVHGAYENYQTPEQSIPAKQQDHPWESCITLGGAWGYVPNENFKSSSTVIGKLIEVVAKGGSLLLGVGPTAEGLMQEKAVEKLNEIGGWLSKNGEAIYGTRITPVYHDGDTWFTKSKDDKKLYALVTVAEGSNAPAVINWTGNVPKKGSKMKLLATGAPLTWKAEGDKVTVNIPAAAQVPTAALAIAYEK
jgi:alpha-L-fucosidase